MSLRRTLVTGGIATTTLALALGTGFALGRTSDPSDTLRDDRIALANADLTVAASCDDLLESYVERGQELVGPYGWGQGEWVAMMEGDVSSDAGSGSSASGSASRQSMPSTSRSTSNGSGTNVQEAGVDEADTVKVTGSLLVRLQRGVLRVYDVSGAAPVELSSLPVEGIDTSSPQGLEVSHAGGELLVVDGRVVVLGGDLEDREVTVTTVDLADPSSPTVVEETVVTGELDAARLHGDVVRLVVRTPLPELDFRDPDWRGERSARSHNREQVAATTLADWLPTVDGEPVTECEDVAVPDDEAALGTTSVIALDPAEPEAWTSTAVATDAATSYFSADRFYLAEGTAERWVEDCWMSCRLPWSSSGFESDGTTSLYAFELDAEETTYVASGEVEGTIADRWSMDAVGGSLRVAVGPSAETGSYSSVVTFREDGASLVEEGRVDELGINEEIKSVRWFDDLAIIVTFRQVDPLYAVDLADPGAPRLMGELKIPGFSEYLHPLGERRLVGVGQDATLQGVTRGAQAALYDVTDLTAPRQLDVVRYPRHSVAGVATDPRQLTWLPDRRTVLTVVSSAWRSRTVWVSVLELDGGAMDNRMVPVERGSDAALVRLVPLASGEVVLVTGEDVSFLDL
ncbi:MAG: hypothetical protein AVDCRST_MAG32-3178 [uncultured Nocardioides sp.]|uniref:Beta propeller domain-containing protein n=1 Tax=uncultured Nocardioides sp. TaxID=198441 RepID=A0A6J4P9G3_9ACTN|nr:MAG: hypothetical protein AVDCRST_MAG32-3178 [uncultured Nocardioides sp.]